VIPRNKIKWWYKIFHFLMGFEFGICAGCGGQKEDTDHGWVEHMTGSCSETDMGSYELCPDCELERMNKELC